MLGGNDMAAAFWSLFQQKLGDNAMVATYDWSLLPRDLIYLLCTKLPELRDVVCFRLVCTAWCSSTSLSNLSPFLPWILTEGSNSNRVTNGDLQFYSPLSCNSYNIHVSQAAGRRLVGPANGYLVTINYDGSLSILNPFIAHEISLPPLKGDMFDPSIVFISQNDNQYKIILFDEDEEDGCLLTQSLEISPPMDNDWKLTKLTSIIDAFGGFAFYNNMYFVTEPSKRCTTILDPTGKFEAAIPDNFTKKGDKVLDYLVESGRKLLRILISTHSNSIEQLSLNVYVLNVDKGYRWLEIKDLDDHILFLDLYGSFSILSSKLHGLRGNCIYFFTHGITVNDEEHSSCFLHKYELGTGNIQNLEFPFQCCGTWFFPSMCQLTS